MLTDALGGWKRSECSKACRSADGYQRQRELDSFPSTQTALILLNLTAPGFAPKKTVVSWWRGKARIERSFITVPVFGAAVYDAVTWLSWSEMPLSSGFLHRITEALPVFFGSTHRQFQGTVSTGEYGIVDFSNFPAAIRGQ